jgi:hypothetical protein
MLTININYYEVSLLIGTQKTYIFIFFLGRKQAIWKDSKNNNN